MSEAAKCCPHRASDLPFPCKPPCFPHAPSRRGLQSSLIASKEGCPARAMGLDGCPPSRSLGTVPGAGRMDRGERSPGLGCAAAERSQAWTALAPCACGAGTDLPRQRQDEPCGCRFPSLWALPLPCRGSGGTISVGQSCRGQWGRGGGEPCSGLGFAPSWLHSVWGAEHCHRLGPRP